MRHTNAALLRSPPAWPATAYKVTFGKTIQGVLTSPQAIGMDHPGFRYLGPPVTMLANTFWTNAHMGPRSGGPFKLSFLSDAQTVEFLMCGANQIAELLVDGRGVEVAGSHRISTDASGSSYILTVQWVEVRQRKYELFGINLLLRAVNLSPDASITYPQDDDERPLLLAVGDSLTLGVGARSYGRSAPAVLAWALGFEYWGDGLGESGWTTTAAGETVAERMERGAFTVAARDGTGRVRPRSSPVVIAAFLGSNDSGAPPAEIAAAWSRWRASVRRFFGREGVAIATFGPWMINEGHDGLHVVEKALCEAVEAARIEGDSGAAFFSLAGATRLRRNEDVLFEDGSHPNDLGHRLIGAAAAARSQSFLHDTVPAGVLCLPDPERPDLRRTLTVLLSFGPQATHVAMQAAVATGRDVVFDGWSALNAAKALADETTTANPIFHAAEAPAFRVFRASLGVGWMRRHVRVVVVAPQDFVAGLAGPANLSEAELIADLSDLKAAGVATGWAMIDQDGNDAGLARLLDEDSMPESLQAPKRLPTFGAGDVESTARGIAAALPLFHAQFRPQDMCADDCMMTGATFARVVCEAGFQSHLWGPLKRRMPVARSGRGVLYIAYGTKYVRIAEYSATSLKLHNPDLRVALVTDEPTKSPVFDFQIHAAGGERVIDDYFLSTDRMESMKFIAFPFSPFADTLFLDCDTLITGRIDDIFDRFPTQDVVLTNESLVALGPDGIPIQKTLDFTDPQSYNAGVFLFRATAAAERWLTAWWAWFLWDQAGPSRKIGNWGHTGVSDQSVLHLMVWADMHSQLGVDLAFAPNVTFNATDRIWALLHKAGRWNEAKVLHSKLPYFLRGTKKADALWMDEWPQRWL